MWARGDWNDGERGNKVLATGTRACSGQETGSYHQRDQSHALQLSRFLTAEHTSDHSGFCSHPLFRTPLSCPSKNKLSLTPPTIRSTIDNEPLRRPRPRTHPPTCPCPPLHHLRLRPRCLSPSHGLVPSLQPSLSSSSSPSPSPYFSTLPPRSPLAQNHLRKTLPTPLLSAAPPAAFTSPTTPA